MFVNQAAFEEGRRHQQVTVYNIIPRQSAEQEDYQILAENIPSSFKEDLRIIQNKKEIEFWIEEKAKAWCKISKLLVNTPQLLFALSGNPSASSASNGTNTFEFFDDFFGTDLNTDKWEINAFGSAMTYEVADNHFRWKSQANTGATYWIYNNTDTGGGHRANWIPVNKCIIEYKIRMSDTADVQCGECGVGFHGADGKLSVFSEMDDPTEGSISRRLDSEFGFIEGTSLTGISGANEDTDYNMQIIRNGNNFEVKRNGVSEGTETSTDISKLVIAGGRVGTSTVPYIQISYLKVRKYVSPEPLILKKRIGGKADVIKAIVSGIVA